MKLARRQPVGWSMGVSLQCWVGGWAKILVFFVLGSNPAARTVLFHRANSLGSWPSPHWNPHPQPPSLSLPKVGSTYHLPRTSAKWHSPGQLLLAAHFCPNSVVFPLCMPSPSKHQLFKPCVPTPHPQLSTSTQVFTLSYSSTSTSCPIKL